MIWTREKSEKSEIERTICEGQHVDSREKARGATAASLSDLKEKQEAKDRITQQQDKGNY